MCTSIVKKNKNIDNQQYFLKHSCRIHTTTAIIVAILFCAYLHSIEFHRVCNNCGHCPYGFSQN